MALLGKRIGIAIPDTVLEERDSLRDKTAKLGTIARACAIYGVDLVEVYRDPKGGGERELVLEVLEYLETPQYLRRRLFPLKESLRFAGTLPPLRIPSHKPKIPVSALKAGEVREGVANSDGTVDIGLDVAPRLDGKVGAGKRVTVKVTGSEPFTAKVVERSEAGEYWGFALESKEVAAVLDDGRFELKIGTSRLGKPLVSEAARLRSSVAGADSILMVFGSPTRGLLEMVGPELPKKVDLVLNLYVEQHVQTVRTEEAIFAGLGLLNDLVA